MMLVVDAGRLVEGKITLGKTSALKINIVSKALFLLNLLMGYLFLTCFLLAGFKVIDRSASSKKKKEQTKQKT